MDYGIKYNNIFLEIEKITKNHKINGYKVRKHQNFQENKLHKMAIFECFEDNKTKNYF